MFFRATVNIKQSESAGGLIWAFFKDFNPESSITIKGKEAKMEIFFEEVPMKIIDELVYCEITEFNYGKTLDDWNQNQSQQQKACDSVESDEISKGSMNLEDDNEILEIRELAEKSLSYEEFIDSVVEWIGLEKEQELFKNVIKAAREVRKITWGSIETYLKHYNITYGEKDKALCSKQVSKKFDSIGKKVTIMKLIKVIVTYQTFEFGKHETVEENIIQMTNPIVEESAVQTGDSGIEETEIQTEEPVVEEIDSSVEDLVAETVESTSEKVSIESEVVDEKNRIRMKCMPEIPCFEEMLANLDKSWPIEKRVRYVLVLMGFEELPQDKQENIFKVANTAVRLKTIDSDTIMQKVKILIGSPLVVKVNFFEFINDFARKYDENIKVKSIDFLKELQSIIMFEDEIENFSDLVVFVK